MAFPPNAFSMHDGRVYSDWEEHKAAAVGVRRFALTLAIGALLLLALDRLLFRSSDAGRLFPAWVSVVALLATALAAAGSYLTGVLRGVELQRPFVMATLLSMLGVAGGAVAAVAAGGLSGALGYGLVPVLLLWPAFMPRGGARSAVPVGGGLVLHTGLCVGLTGAGALNAQGTSLVVFMVMAVVASLVIGQTVETWRGKAAEYSKEDWLTHALSRPALEERMTVLLSERGRTPQAVTLVMFDVDRFRVINDLHGRGAGDEVLEMMVAGIKAEIRPTDILGRYGGDEFLLVLDQCDGNSAVMLLERLRERLCSKPMSVKDQELNVSFSAGIVSVTPGDPLVLRDLLRRAETALSISKDSGRNRTLVAPPPPPPMGNTNTELPVISTDAVETAAYQPPPGEKPSKRLRPIPAA
jgi:diguanylate cyclase (GGDEF)-like protein